MIKKLLFSVVVFLFFLILAEGMIRLAAGVVIQSETHTEKRTVFCLGDSVTMGHGVEEGKGWPELLGRRFQRSEGSEISVVNRSFDGVASSYLLRDTEIKAVRKSAEKGENPIVLVMIGHIDFFGSGQRKLLIPQLPASEWSAKPVSEPFIFDYGIRRMLSWGLRRVWLRRQNIEWEPEIQSRLSHNLSEFKKALDRIGSRLYVMTYLVPGAPDGVLNPNAARQVSLVRKTQPLINQILRETATTIGANVIDPSFQVQGPKAFSNRWFMDHIHPTERAHQAIAQSTAKHLAAFSEIPLSTLR